MTFQELQDLPTDFHHAKKGRGKGLQRSIKKSQYMRRRCQAEQSESQAKNVPNMAKVSDLPDMAVFTLGGQEVSQSDEVHNIP